MSAFIQILTGFIGSLGFGILFNVRGKRLVFASFGGLISWSLYLLLKLAIADESVCYFIVSASITLYCELMSRVLRTPKTTFLMTSLIPLIPGGGLYYTMTNVLTGKYSNFMEKAISTLSLAVALALGVIIVTVVFRIINKYKRNA